MSVVDIIELRVCSQLDPAIKISLLDKPHIHGFPFPARLFEFKVKVSNQLWDKFCHLEETDVLSDAGS
jgi:hypothetical protein